MNSLLTELDLIWRSADSESYSLLREPMTSAQFKQLTDLIKVDLPGDYRLIFEWKGGQSAMAERGILPEWRLMQYEEIRIEYQSMLELYEMGEFSNLDWWRPEWLPLLTNAGGNTIYYDRIGALGGNPRQLIEFAPDSGDRIIWFPSLDALLETAIFAFKNTDEVKFPEGYPISRVRRQ